MSFFAALGDEGPGLKWIARICGRIGEAPRTPRMVGASKNISKRLVGRLCDPVR